MCIKYQDILSQQIILTEVVNFLDLLNWTWEASKKLHRKNFVLHLKSRTHLKFPWQST
jgi:hypothetical protein